MRAPAPLPLQGRLLYAVYQCAAACYAGYLRLRLAIGAGYASAAVAAGERLGRWGEAAEREGDVIWLHAASVGEVQLLAPMLAALRRACPHCYLLLTCNTATARAVAQGLGSVEEIRYFPVDYGPILARLLSEVRPRLFVFVETEIWPALLLALADAGVPAAMVNARVSARSFPRYLRVRPVVGPALATVAAVCARDERSHARLQALGVQPARLRLTGDLKADVLDPERVAATADLLHGDGDGGVAPTMLAISTHRGEDETVLTAFAQLRRLVPEARLIVAPRHPERCDDVVRLAAGLGTVLRWSETRAGLPAAWDVLVVDTTGELRGFMKSATAGFVGGSLAEVGGHNLLEPAAFGLPFVTGPSLGNVREQADALAAAGCLDVVHEADSLAAAWAGWVADPAARAERAAGLKEIARTTTGALAATLEALAPLLPRAEG